MKLSANTFVYEVGQVPIREALKSLKKFGFQYIDLAAYQSADPARLSEEERKDLVKDFQDYGFVSSQLLLVHTQDMASSDPARRQRALDSMKQATDFQLELGGKQVLVCWGCGVREIGVPPEQTWLNSVNLIREYAQWCQKDGILVDLEMDPHVYFVVNSMEKMARMLEDVNQSNVYPNVDIGHMCITRETPRTLLKFRDRIIHVHISETDTFEHTNSIIGTGKADFASYIAQVNELQAEETCHRIGETLVAGIEMGEPGGKVDDPNRWIGESLEYLKKTVPDCTL